MAVLTRFLGRPSRSELRAGIGIEPPIEMPPAEVNASESLSYAEGVKHRSPGQGTASYRAVTPPWVVNPEFGGRACGVDLRGADAETAIGHVVPLVSGQRRMHHGQFGVRMGRRAAEIQGLTNDPRLARPGHRFHLVTVLVSASARRFPSPRHSLGRYLGANLHPGRRGRSLHSRALALGYDV